MCVVDVGANIGNYARDALNGRMNVHYHGFEPVRSTYEVLTTQLKGITGNHIHLNNCACGSEAGSAEIFVSDGTTRGSRSSLVDLEMVPDSRPETVQIVTLRDYFRDNAIEQVDLVKIDVEGFEVEVMRGIDFTVVRPRMIQFEYNNTWLGQPVFLREAFELLSGYTIYRLLPYGMKPVEYTTAYPDNLETFSYCNYLALDEGVQPPLPLAR